MMNQIPGVKVKSEQRYLCTHNKYSDEKKSSECDMKVDLKTRYHKKKKAKTERLVNVHGKRSRKNFRKNKNGNCRFELLMCNIY